MPDTEVLEAPAVESPSPVTQETEIPVSTPEIDLSAFDKLITSKNDKSVAEPKVEEKPKAAEEKVAIEPTKPTTEEKTTAKPTEARDYTGFDENETQLLKRMSNEAFNSFRPKLLEHKEMAKKVQEYEAKVKELSEKSTPIEPEAYLLDPEYRKSAGITSQASKEVAYWKAQYQKVRSGEDWEDLVPDGKGGITTVTRPADANAELDLTDRIAYGNQLIMQHSAFQQNMQKGYTDHYKGLVGSIKSVEDKYFPQWKEAESVKSNPHIQSMQQALAAFKQQNNPVAGMLSKLYAAYMELLDKSKEAPKVVEETKKAKLKEIKTSVGPSSSEMQAGASIGTESVKETLDEFEKVISHTR